LGKKPNIWKDELKDWLIWILHSPNRNIALTNHSTLQYSKPIQKLNRKQAKQNLFLSRRPNCYEEESTNRILLSDEMIIKTVDEKLHRLIEEENTQKIPPMKGILLPWHPQMKDTLRDDNLFYDESCPESCIIDLLGSIAFGFRMVVEDHRSSTGVILVYLQPYNKTVVVDLQPYNKTIGTKRTTIVSSNSLDK
jgi:hypothetical protein